MKKLALVLLVAGLLAGAQTAQAAVLTGDLAVGGLADVRVTTTLIDWGQIGNLFGTPVGDVTFTSGTGSFSTLTNTNGLMKDLSSTAQPVGVTFTLDKFITANTWSNLDFILNYIYLGYGTAAGCNNTPGSLCTPGVSPFTIVNNSSGGSSVEFSARGIVTDGTGPASAFIGNFTTQFPNLTSGQIITLLTNQGFVQSSHSSKFVVTAIPAIPEPASLLLFGTGLAGLAARRRRNRKA